MATRVLIVTALAVILGIPFALHVARDAGSGVDGRARGQARVLVIVTPHVPQIRDEFGQAFERWHRRVHGEAVRIDWRAPGGTSEIIRLLQGQFAARAEGTSAPGRAGAFDLTDPDAIGAPPGTIDFDLMFGGGSFDHGRLKEGIPVRVTDAGGSVSQVRLPMSVPAGFTQEQLDGWFGENRIGAQRLYDPDQHWIGTALSSFGIVFNRDVLRDLGVPEPRSFADLADPRLSGWIILADPRQSGSVTTTLDSILSNQGWEAGWRIIREMAANTRYFTNSAPRPPIDISQGEAAAGLAIDFYGRGQAQAVLAPGQPAASGRVGYVDPAGSVYIDADPASILLGGRSPDLARRFIEFCLSDEGQALWNLPSRRDGRSASNPRGEDGEPLGPRVSELRRLPVRRDFYERFGAFMMDPVDPFALASPTTPAGWRAGIGVMMGAFAIDSSRQIRGAWRALNRARVAAAQGRFPPDVLARMEDAFYAWPTTPQTDAEGRPTGVDLPFTADTFRAVRAEWRKPGIQARMEIRYTRFFRERYEEVMRLGAEAGSGAGAGAGAGAGGR